MVFSSGIAKFQIPLVILIVNALLGSITGAPGTEYKQNGSSVVPRIHGGTAAGETEAPYAVALYLEERYKCTFSIITPRTIIGVAHCLFDEAKVMFPIEKLHCRIGNIDKEAGRVTGFEKVNVHEKYLALKHDFYKASAFDIATLITAEEMRFDDRTNRIRLGHKFLDLKDKPVTVYGWGRLNKDSEETAKILQKLDGKIVSHRACQHYWRETPFKITANHICTLVEFPKYTCKGDSGAPIVYKDGSGVWLVGVHAYEDIAKQGLYSVIDINMAVIEFGDWIRAHTRK